MMKIAYIAGPYRRNPVTGESNPWEIRQNIERAEKYALKYWRLGYAVICPHKNTALFDGAAPDEVWLAGDLAMMAVCDFVVAIPGWKSSSGATAELIEAEKLGMEIIYDQEIL